MLKETYLAKLKQMKEKYPDAHFEVVTRTAKSILSPSYELLTEYKVLIKDLPKNEIIELFEKAYTPRFEKEMLYNNKCHDRMKELALMSIDKDVFLVCYEKEYPCHRFILKKYIENYAGAFLGIRYALSSKRKFTEL